MRTWAAGIVKGEAAEATNNTELGFGWFTFVGDSERGGMRKKEIEKERDGASIGATKFQPTKYRCCRSELGEKGQASRQRKRKPAPLSCTRGQHSLAPAS